MSYCAIVIFKDGLPHGKIEFRNSWGGAARIWSALFDKHLKNPAIPYHNWLAESEQQKLWALVNRADLPIYERTVHASTLDFAFIKREHFPIFCTDLRAFDVAYPAPEKANHLPAWADAIEKLDCEGIGFHGTSVAENPWKKYDEEKDVMINIPLAKGWEIYDTLAPTPSACLTRGKKLWTPNL